MTEIIRLLVTAVVSFGLTFVLLYFLPFGKALLGQDRGRKFAIGSEVNIGKPTGVGIYFSTVFTITMFAFGKIGIGMAITAILILLSMLFGFLDDRSKTPWGEYIKGALDFVIAIIGGISYPVFFGNDFTIGITGTSYSFNPIVFAILAVILYIVSINATNATDGVDGLSGTLTIISVLTLMAVHFVNGSYELLDFIPGVAVIFALGAYLIFNHYPSKMLMGDAGSRAIGFFIAFYAMYLKLPFAYLVIGLPFLIDGGLSILKITIGRLTKKKVIILKNILTPIHDHLKKKKGFSVPKTWATIVLFGLVIDIIYIVICAII